MHDILKYNISLCGELNIPYEVHGQYMLLYGVADVVTTSR